MLRVGGMMGVMLTPEHAAALEAARLEMKSARAEADARITAAEGARRAAILAAVEEGASQSEVARALGLTQASVNRILNGKQ